MSAILRRLICLVICLVACGGALDAAVYQITVQPITGELPGAGRYSAYVPDGVAKVRALIFHQHGCGGIQAVEMMYDLHWQALANKWDAVLIGDDLDDDCGKWYRPTDGSKAMQERAFAYFATQSGHPEINTAPLCIWGHSGGGDWTSEYVQRYPEKVVAVYARSGGHDVGPACNGVPILFSNAFPDSNDYNIDLSGTTAAGRGRGALWAWMIDPNGSHDCSNGRYVAIPYFDACMALRLPAPPVAAEAVTLRTIAFTAGWTGVSAKAQIGQVGYGAIAAATAGAATDNTRSWLPSQDVAQRWSQFVTSGNGGQLMGGVTDTSAAQSAPTAVVAAVSGSNVTLTWSAVADLQSGIKSFVFYRDDVQVGTLGNWFQGHGFGDEPQPSNPTMTWTDNSVANGTHWYEVAVMNGRDLIGPRSARIPVLIGSSSDSSAPTITITTSSGGSATTSAASIAVSGSASDNIGVATVVWSNNRGGTGIASGTTAWSIAGVPLRSGTNTIRVTAFDAANHATTATLVVVSSNGGAIPATITAQPIDQASDVGLTATFAITAVGAPPLTYQWESAPAGSATFTAIAGATAASYTTPTITAGMNGNQFRCTVTSNASTSALSSSARLLIPRPADGASGGAVGLDYRFYLAGDGNLPNFAPLTPNKIGTVTDFDLSPRTQDSNFSFQFLGYLAVPTDGSYTLFTTSDDGSRFFIGSTLVVENNGLHGMQEASGSIALKAGLHAILVQFSQGAGGLGLEVRWQGTGIAKAPIPGSALFRTLSGAATVPAITTQPGNQAVIVGQTATFTVAASGTPTPTFQWQKNNTNISGATSASYTTPATVIGDNGATFRCIATNTAGNATSASATLTVTTVADSTPPPKPSMPAFTGNGTTTVTLSGTAEAGAIIRLIEGSTVIATTTATGGTWTLTPALGVGSHTLHVTATDAAGNVSVPSDSVTVTVAAGSGPGPAPAPASASSGGGCGSGSGISALLLALMLTSLRWRRRSDG